METALLEKEGEVARLRSKEGSRDSQEGGEGELVMAFPDTAVYHPATPMDTTPDIWQGLGIGEAFLLSLIPSVLYLLGLYLLERMKKGRRKKERKETDYDYDD